MTQTPPPLAPAPRDGRGLGTAGLVLGILAAIVSFIPCLGAWALVPGIVAIILSVISLVQAGKVAAPKGMAIAGLVCGLVGTAIAIWWCFMLAGAAHALQDNKGMLDSLNNLMQNSGVLDSLNKAMEEMKDIADSANNSH